MYITWHSLGCIKIQSKLGNILVEPFDEKANGALVPKGSLDIIIDGYGCFKKPKDSFMISYPGEYEVKGVFVYYNEISFKPNSEESEDSTKKKDVAPNVFFSRINVEDVTIGHLSNLAKVPKQDKLELIEGVDVLFVPVGGKSVLDHKQAVQVINIIEPKIVIPIYYAHEEVKGEYEDVTKFLKEFGQTGLEAMDKVKITKKDLPMDETKVFLLK